ncbi:MAG: flagellar hook-basal body complex protein [bacterium]
MSGSAFYSAVAGMKSNQLRLDVIANNIANINTYGFKGSRVTFSELLSQMLSAASSPQGGRGGINPMQIGLGVKLASIDSIMGQGSIQNTGNPRDLAINGDGFFILEGEGGTRYTRAGNFMLDYNGTLLSTEGLRVQGYNGLTPDGLSINTNTTIGDIQINFGEKIAARATEEVRYRSNLNAGSNLYGTAELTSPGATGFTLAAGTMVPIATANGAAVNDGSGTPLADSVAGNQDLLINGQEIVYLWPPGWTWGDAAANAELIADAINSQSTTVYATVGGDNNLILQSMFGGENNDVRIGGNNTTPGFLSSIGLTAGTYEAPESSSALAGRHDISLVDATNAIDTSTNPVQAGALTADFFYINDVLINYGATPATNTSAENAQVIANAINNAAGLAVTATANSNGTITLKHDLAGEANVIAIENEGTALSVTGLDTLGALMTNPFPGAPGTAVDAYVINNGENAMISNTFTSDSGLISWTRTFLHETTYGTQSTLDALMGSILGDNPALPLIPGVTLIADDLNAGQATVLTYTAFEHETSINVYDSLGKTHFLALKFKHVGENRWEWRAELPEEPNLMLSNASGEFEFGVHGMISTPNPAAPLRFTPFGADTVQISLIFDGKGDPISGISQFGSSTTARAEHQDGYEMGVLQTIAFDPTGVLHGGFSNGQVRSLAQIALANFNNAEGLERAGDNNFRQSSNSGIAIISTALTGGAGSIVPGALEQSNVDLANEFTEMIVSQRGFQANARVITTQDALLAEAVNLVR